MRNLQAKLLWPFLLTISLTWAGCGTSDNEFLVTQSGATQSAPVAQADVYSTAFETPLIVAANTGVLTNDTPNAVSGRPVSVIFQSSSVAGGQVTSTGNGGAFTYTPPTGFLGRDTFGYELSNGIGVSRTTVIVEVTSPVGPGIVVDSSTGNDSTGNFQTGSPFATVQAAVAAAGPGGEIVVLPGRGTYTGEVDLLDGQRLLGTESALVNAQGVVRPTLSGPIILADGNTLDSLRVVRTQGIAIDGDGQNSGSLTNCEVGDNQGGTGIQLRDVQGNWVVEDNMIFRTDGIGLDMDTQGADTAVIRANRNQISDCRLFGLGAAGLGQGELKVQVNDNVLTGNGFGLGPNGLAIGMLFPSAGTATLTLQLVGNQNEGLYGFLQGSATSTINVERFSQFATLNTGNPVVLKGEVQSVAVGFAGF